MARTGISRRCNTVLAGIAGLALAATAIMPQSASALADIQIVPQTEQALSAIAQSQESQDYVGKFGLDGFGKGSSSTGDTQPAPTAKSDQINLVTYDGGFFTMTIPQGWQVLVGGYGASTTIEVYDPADPATRILYYGELPMHISPLFKQQCVENSAVGGAAGLMYTTLAAYPMLDNDNWTLAGLVDKIDDLCWNIINMGGEYAPNAFVASSVTVTSTKPVTYMSPLFAGLVPVADEAIVGCDLTLMDGTACRADFLGTLIISGDPGYVGMADAMNMWGTVSSVERYDEISPVLAQCVGTLQFSQEYVESAIQNGEIIVENATAYFEAMSAVSSAATRDFCDYILDRDRYTFSDGTEVVIYY